MKETFLNCIPFVLAGTALLWPRESSRPWLLPIAGVAHVFFAFWLMISPPATMATPWLGFDPLARAVLPVVSLLFLACSFYGVAYLRQRVERPNRIFVSSLLGLLGLLTLALQSQHLGLLWITVEGATLVTVPLLHFNGTARAFEATWKYLLVGGTGIALSLLGTFFLGYASLGQGGGGDLTFAALTAQGQGLTRPWVLAAWVLLLTGYGTKMGLAPMHTWKPDAYGEAPGIIGAVLAGGVTTVAFVALLRVRQVVDAAGLTTVASNTLLALGLFSMLVAALFLLGTPDFKRMLAYSSVEHMGILSVGAALGGVGVWAALFHLWNNSITKGALFLSAGNIRRAAGTSQRCPVRTSTQRCPSTPGEDVRGMAWLTPISMRILVIGLFAITACPPFGPFFSELKILRATIGGPHPWAAALFLAALLLAFFGMTRLIFGIADGRPTLAARRNCARFRETFGVLAPPIILLACSLVLGVATPESLQGVWTAAVNSLFPSP